MKSAAAAIVDRAVSTAWSSAAAARRICVWASRATDSACSSAMSASSSCRSAASGSAGEPSAGRSAASAEVSAASARAICGRSPLRSPDATSDRASARSFSVSARTAGHPAAGRVEVGRPAGRPRPAAWRSARRRPRPRGCRPPRRPAGPRPARRSASCTSCSAAASRARASVTLSRDRRQRRRRRSAAAGRPAAAPPAGCAPRSAAIRGASASSTCGRGVLQVAQPREGLGLLVQPGVGGLGQPQHLAEHLPGGRLVLGDVVVQLLAQGEGPRQLVARRAPAPCRSRRPPPRRTATRAKSRSSCEVFIASSSSSSAVLARPCSCSVRRPGVRVGLLQPLHRRRQRLPLAAPRPRRPGRRRHRRRRSRRRRAAPRRRPGVRAARAGRLPGAQDVGERDGPGGPVALGELRLDGLAGQLSSPRQTVSSEPSGRVKP